MYCEWIRMGLRRWCVLHILNESPLISRDLKISSPPNQSIQVTSGKYTGWWWGSSWSNRLLEVTPLRCYYILTSRCRVLLEKLTGLQLVKKFPAFHGIRRFITALTSVRHLSLSWASPIQSIYPHPTSWRYILILSTHLRLRLTSGLLPLQFPHQDPIHPSFLTHTRHSVHITLLLEN